MKNNILRIMHFLYNTKLPNRLTFARIILAPVVMFLVMYCNSNYVLRFFAASICSLLFLTDYFDGYFARKLNAKSNFGRCFDPIADKILVMSVFLSLIYLRKADIFPIVIIISREFIVSGIREFLSKDGIEIPVSYIAKLKTAVQFGAIIFLILGKNGDYITEFGNLLLWIAAILTFYTMLDYIKKIKSYIL